MIPIIKILSFFKRRDKNFNNLSIISHRYFFLNITQYYRTIRDDINFPGVIFLHICSRSERVDRSDIWIVEGCIVDCDQLSEMNRWSEATRESILVCLWRSRICDRNQPSPLFFPLFIQTGDTIRSWLYSSAWRMPRD